MTVVFARDEHTGILCGVEDGELFLCNYRGGYTMPDTPANRNQLMRDFFYYKQVGFWGLSVQWLHDLRQAKKRRNKVCNGCTLWGTN